MLVRALADIGSKYINYYIFCKTLNPYMKQKIVVFEILGNNIECTVSQKRNGKKL